MSWVVSLGAGKEQLPLIRAIQSEGFYCLAFDSDVHAPGWDVADDGQVLSNRDVDGIMEFIRTDTIKPVGVMAAASEVPDVMAILAHRLGTPGVPVAAGMLIKDKYRYKQVLKAAGVPHTETIEEPDGGPLVVKPRVSSGSRGVELYSAGSIPIVPNRETHMLERYQPGPQISSETIIWDEKAVTVAFADRHYAGFAKEVGVSMPSRFESERESSHRLAVSAAKALGIRRGTLKCDLVLTEEGPKIIELTCRLSGWPLQPLVEMSTGLNYYREAVKIAVGKEPDWESMTQRPKKVSLDMRGNETSWEEAGKWIEKKLGSCE